MLTWSRSATWRGVKRLSLMDRLDCRKVLGVRRRRPPPYFASVQHPWLRDGDGPGANSNRCHAGRLNARFTSASCSCVAHTQTCVVPKLRSISARSRLVVNTSDAGAFSQPATTHASVNLQHKSHFSFYILFLDISISECTY